MATRSLIGIRNKDEVRFVYCHYDGYPTEKGVGGKLIKYWQTPEIANNLLKGDIKSLGSDIGSTIRFLLNESEGFRTVDYEEYGSRNWLKVDFWDIEYVYLYDEKWLYKEANSIEWKELKELSHSLY